MQLLLRLTHGDLLAQAAKFKENSGTKGRPPQAILLLRKLG